MNLYDIDSAIMECVDSETGEIFDIDKFNALGLERDTKIENIALWIKNLKAEAEALKAEKDNFAARQKAAENKMNSLKQYLSNYLDGAKYDSTKVKVSFRKSETLQIDEGATIPEDFLKYKEPEVNKAELKKALKEGFVVPGVEIVENMNIQIK